MKEKTRLLNHEICISQDPAGGWHCWITGPQPFVHGGTFRSADEAKKVGHFIAHSHLESKSECDCVEPLVWVSTKTTKGG